MSRITVGILCGYILMALIAGCQTAKIKEKSNASETLQNAENLIEEEEYEDAINLLKEMINFHPSSPLLENAYFEIGRSYYLDGQKVEAEVALDDFSRLYPDSKLFPKALLLKGKNLERDKEKPGRDQSFTEKAINIYTQIVKKYPDSAEANEARSRIIVLRDHLAKHELLIAQFYIKTKKLPSAEKRLKMAFEKYADTQAVPEIVNMLAETYLSQKKENEAQNLLEFMEKYYPERDETTTLREEIKGADR
jgi:outer membrane protein assembly factor BamD